MLDVLVTCTRHIGEIQSFPQVRGFYLAKHLSQLGLRAAFEQLPAEHDECRVLICSEYQQTMDWFERRLATPLSQIKAERMFCMADKSLYGMRKPHFSLEYCTWFARRGGVLCHLAPRGLDRHDHWIGVGVDPDVVRPDPAHRRTDVVFDFPKSSELDTAARFDTTILSRLRGRRFRHLRLVGSGPPDAPIRDAFDEWVPYGQPHAAYVQAAFARAVAVVPGCDESLGLALAEAQVAGACIVAPTGEVRPEMLVPEAAVHYRRDRPRSLAKAIAAASRRDADRIRAEAIERFDHAAVARRVRAAIGLA